MNILVINCGSSSLKYQLIDMEKENTMAQGLVERIGLTGSSIAQKVNGNKHKIEVDMKDHKEAMKQVLDLLVDGEYGVIKSLDEISAVGHRVVHGGERYLKSVVVDDKVMEDLKECVKLAPLHNGPNRIGIEACKALMPNVPMVLVFDTAFHSTMPEKAFLYALPYELYEKNHIRKYGFHGTSHKYVSRKIAEVLGKNVEDLKIISCHIGNGASITAIKDGKSIDTTMGFTPLDGLVMGTRCGSIDPSIVTHLITDLGYTAEEVNEIMNKKSGVYGITNISSDLRDIKEAAYEHGDKRAQLALDIYAYKIKLQIGAYAAAMNGVDCILFTAGIGENSWQTRIDILEGLEYMGVKLDRERNNVMGELAEISTDDSKVKVYVVPTNEELMIAKETAELLK
ncbi:MAG: acetate kinase [Clostridium sp.]|jgi:acetate kinase|nr:acetate kinase [Clostridium sp.]